MNTLLQGVHVLGRDGSMSSPRDVLVAGDRIAAVGAAAAPPKPGATLVDGRGKLLMPGLINAHFHSPVNHMKGRLDGLPLEIFMLYESPALEGLMPSPREAYVRTQLACAEMLRTGVTAVQDDAFFVPHPTTGAMVAEANARDVGMNRWVGDAAQRA